MRIWLLVAAIAAMWASSAQAELPAIKRATGQLIAPAQAWSFYGSSKTHTAGLADANEVGPEIRALARGLGAGRATADQYAQNVFDYVRNNIAIEFHFGLGKGARATLIDLSGTSFDQADLMVKLLQQGNVPNVSYRIGTITLDRVQFGRWSGLVLDPSASDSTLAVDGRAACQLLADGGVPALVNGQTACSSISGSLTTVTLAHVWVAANGKLYDPAYKRQTLKGGLDVTSLLGCGSASSPTCGAEVVTKMMVGATEPSIQQLTGVQNANVDQAKSQVSTFAQNLQHAIEANMPAAGLDDLVGGAKVDLAYAPVASSNLPYPSQEQDSWTAAEGVPNQYRSTVRVQVVSIDRTFYADEVAARRVRLLKGALYVEGVNVAPCGDACWLGSTITLTVTATHPYAPGGPVAAESVVAPMGQAVTIVQAWGEASSATQRYYSDLQAANPLPLLTDPNAICTATPPGANCRAEDQPGIAASILVQRTMANRIVGQLARARITTHHTIGAITGMGDLSAVAPNYLITAASTVSVTSSTYDAAAASAAFEVSSILQSTVEGAAGQQARDAPRATSGVANLVAQAKLGASFVLIPNSSVAAVSQALFSGLNIFPDATSGGYDVLTAAGSMTVFTPPAAYPPFFLEFPAGQAMPFIVSAAYLAVKPGASSYLVHGLPVPLKGAAAGAPKSVDPVAGVMKTTRAAEAGRKTSEASVNEATGALTLSPAADLVTGAGEFPLSLPFRRFYNSDSNATETVDLINTWLGSWRYHGLDEDSSTHLGGGWIHNFQITARVTSNPQKVFGRDSALDASAAVAAGFILYDLLKAPDLKRRLASYMAADWLNDQLNGNSVVVTLPPSQEVFVKLPDGRFNAPPGSGSSLQQQNARLGPIAYVQPAGWTWDYAPVTFTHTARDGAKIDFDIGSYSGNNNTIQLWFGEPVFKATAWTFPSGVKIRFEYDMEELNWGSTPGGPLYRHFYLARVYNSLGRRLEFTNVHTGLDVVHFTWCGTTCVSNDQHKQWMNVGRRLSAVTAIESAGGQADRVVQFSLEGCPLISAAWGPKGLACDTFRVTDPMNFVARYEYAPDAASPDPAILTRPNYRLRRAFASNPAFAGTPLLTFRYDDLFRVQSRTDALSRVSLYLTGGVSEEVWKRSERVDARGYSWLSWADDGGKTFKSKDPTGAETTYAYDALRRLTRTTYPEGNAEATDYDARSNVRHVTRIAKPGSTLASTTVEYRYVGGEGLGCANPLVCNKVERVIDARNATTSFEWDSASGVLKRIIRPADLHGAQGIATYDYTPTTMGADVVQLPTTATQLIAIGNAASTTFSYDSANKFVLRTATVDPSGLNLTTTFDFSPRGDLVQVNGPRTDVADVSNYVWDLDRRLTHEVLPDPDGGGPARRTTAHWTYDEDGLFTSIEKGSSTSAAADGFIAALKTDYDHDAVGNRVREAVRDLSSSGQPVVSLTQTTYDANDLSDCIVVRMNLGVAAPASACDLGTTGTDGQDRITHYDYTARGEVEKVFKAYKATLPDGGGPLIEEFAYSPNGKRTAVIDANGNKTTQEYDGFDRLWKQWFPVETPGLRTSSTVLREEYGYDPNDNRTSFKRRNLKTISYDYDALNRMTARRLEDDAAHNVAYDYDLVGHRTEARFGTLSGQGNHLEYDKAGRLTLDSTYGRSVASEYLGNDRVKLTLHDSFAVRYDYDAAGRVSGIREPSAGLCPGFGPLICLSYDDLGRRNRMDRGNGQGGAADYAYDGAGRLKHLLQQGAASEPGSVQDIKYNPASQMRELTQLNANYVWRGRPSAMPDRAYDGLNRDSTLTPLEGGGYDANGNLRRDGVRTFLYDLENRLTKVTVDAHPTQGVLEIKYDPLGRLMETVSGAGSANSVTTDFLYDGDRLVGEYAANGTALRHYVHGPGVDEPLVWFEGGVKRWLLSDRQGSVVGYWPSPETGGVKTYTYGPWGEPSQWGDTRFGYTGQAVLGDAQLYHYKARVYDPMAGRFLQTDPIGQQDDLNLYAYVKGDPVNKTDPTGTQEFDFGGKESLQLAERQMMSGDLRGASNNYIQGGLATMTAGLLNGFTKFTYAATLMMGPGAAGGKAAVSETVQLTARAKELHAVINPIAQEMRTTAVVSTEQGGKFVASSEKLLTPAQRAALKPGETAAAGEGHAEVTAARAAKAAGQKPVAAGASRTVCEKCAAELKAMGIAF